MRALLQVSVLVMVLVVFGTVTAGAQNGAAEAIKAVNQLFQEYVAEGNADALTMSPCLRFHRKEVETNKQK